MSKKVSARRAQRTALGRYAFAATLRRFVTHLVSLLLVSGLAALGLTALQVVTQRGTEAAAAGANVTVGFTNYSTIGLNYAVDNTSITAGGQVTYTYTVMNSSLATVTVASISDSACSNVAPTPGSVTIAPKGQAVFTCTTTLSQTTYSTVNVGISVGGGKYSATAHLTVNVIGTSPTNPPPMTAIDCSVPKIWDAANPSGQLYTVLNQQVQDSSGASFVPIGSNTTLMYNALAYSSNASAGFTSNFLYAMSTGDATGVPGGKNNTPYGHLYKIDANGTINDLGLIDKSAGWTFSGGTNAYSAWQIDALQGGGINAGTFDPTTGIYYVANMSTSGTGAIYAVNLANKTVTNVTPSYYTTQGAASNPNRTNDFTYLGGYLWGIQNGTNTMIRVKISDGSVSTFPLSGLASAAGKTMPATTYGAAWTYGNGNLGFDDNGNSTTGIGTGYYQISVTSPSATTPTFALVYNGPGPASFNNDGASCTFQPYPDLSMQKFAPANAATSSTVSFTLRVTNNGPGVSSGGVVTDKVPPGYTNVTVPSMCTYGSGAVQCATGQLNAGAFQDFVFTATAPSTAGCLTNTASVLGNETENNNNNADNTASAQTCIVSSNIDVIKSAPTATATGPDANGNYTATYSIQVKNSGTAAGTYTQLTDLPQFTAGTAIQSVSWSGGPGNAGSTPAPSNGSGGYLVGTSASKNLAVGATDTYQVTVVYKSTATASAPLTLCSTGQGLTNTVSLPEETGPSANNTACVNPAPLIQVVKTVVAAGQPGPGTAKSLAIPAGSSVDYYYQVTATGSAEPLKTVTLTDDKCPNPTLQSGDANANKLLDPGETWLYKCTQSLSTMTINTATAQGVGNVTGATVKATDTATVTTSSINLVKTAGAVNGPDSLGVYTVVYTITATNSGGAAGTYGPIIDTPAFDKSLTPTGASWTGAATGSATGTGPYTIGASHQLAANSSETYTVTVSFKFNSYVTPSACNGSGTGLYNSVSAAGENGSTADNSACAPPPSLPRVAVSVAKLGVNCGVSQPTCPLSGAAFAIYATDPTGTPAPQPVSSGAANTGANANVFTSTGLQPGTYWLVETTAPSGHVLLATPIKFTVDPTAGVTITSGATSAVATVGGTNNLTISVNDQTPANLPKAGGDGFSPYLLLGLLLVATGGIAFHLTSARRPRPES